MKAINLLVCVMFVALAAMTIHPVDNSVSATVDLDPYRQAMQESDPAPAVAEAVETPEAPEPAEPELSPNRIRIYWGEWCAVCPKWEAEELPNLERNGYGEKRIERIEVFENDDRFPWITALPAFEILVEGEPAERIIGYATAWEIGDRHNSAFKRGGVPIVDMNKPKPEPVQVATSYPLRSNNWNFEGTHNVSKSQAINHLLSHSNHRGKFTRAQLEAMSLAELRSLHSDDHEGQVKRYALSAVAVPSQAVRYRVPRQVQYRSGCPGGRCPR